MTIRTLLKATDARFQSLKIGPLPPLITGDPLRLLPVIRYPLTSVFN